MATRKRFDPRSALPGSPFLTHVTLREDRVQPGVHPFTVPWLQPSLDLELSAPVTFLVGENGTGKSTLLEAIAWSVGFGAQGGNRDQSFAEDADGYALGRALRLSWRQKVSGGFFLRAETFFNFATYLEDVGSPFIAYGGKSLHQQSHGNTELPKLLGQHVWGRHLIVASRRGEKYARSSRGSVLFEAMEQPLHDHKKQRNKKQAEKRAGQHPAEDTRADGALRARTRAGGESQR
jgi:hypothetical protein